MAADSVKSIAKARRISMTWMILCLFGQVAIDKPFVDWSGNCGNLSAAVGSFDGEPVDYCLARIPAQGETRGNLAAGGRGEARPLSEKDRWIAAQVGPTLREKGLLFVGLDVIGEHLTEINVTSPTCDGLGVKQFFDIKRLVNGELTLAEGAIRGWDRRNTASRLSSTR